MIFLVSCSAQARQGAVVTAGLSLAQFDYVEEISNGGASEEKGLMPFLELGYRAPLGESWELDLRFLGALQAKTDYSGTELNSGQKITAQNEHGIMDFEMLLSVFAAERVRIFGGGSVRRWDRKLTYGTGYREIYLWWTATLGGALWVGQGDLWDFWVEAAVRPMISGSVNAILSETVVNGEDSTLNLGTRVGYRLRLPWAMEIQPATLLVVAPFYEINGFGESAPVYNATPGIQREIKEPSSHTTQTGLSLSLRFFL
ncbi:MAG: hypothetical protein KF865_07210 [Bdellovibrionaceae bacterium]|nr:hypothetical protein [Pseudobdellovibrionaceae bacterium]